MTHRLAGVVQGYSAKNSSLRHYADLCTHAHCGCCLQIESRLQRPIPPEMVPRLDPSDTSQIARISENALTQYVACRPEVQLRMRGNELIAISKKRLRSR